MLSWICDVMEPRSTFMPMGGVTFVPTGRSPRVGSAAVVYRDGKILLGKRGKHPNKDMWTIPGGKVEWLESLESAVKRELMEEANIEIELKGQVATYDIINPPHIHRVIVVWLAEYLDGEVKGGSDMQEAAFFTKEEARALIRSPITTRILEDVGYLKISL